MATIYVDYVNGADSVGRGTTFANAYKTISYATTNSVAGDEIRVAKSTDPTSIGSASWVGSSMSLYGGGHPNNIQGYSIAISAIANGPPMEVTTSTNHGFSSNDWVHIYAQTGCVRANGLWKITVTSPTKFTLNGSVAGSGGNATGYTSIANNRILTLSSPVTQTIDLATTVWTRIHTQVTATLSEGSAGCKSPNAMNVFAIGNSFPSGGNVAYKNLSSTINGNGYYQISFWIAANANIAANTFRIDLYSGTGTGNNLPTGSILDSFTIATNLIGATSSGGWHPLTIARNGGGQCSSGINSIVITSLLDPGTVTIYVNDFILCKAAASADSLSLTSLISKNTATEPWLPIQHIDGTTVVLGNSVDCKAYQGRGYVGTTESVTTYKRETIRTTKASTVTSIVQQINKSGTDLLPITISGGWNTSTNVQDSGSLSIFDGTCGYGLGLDSASSISFNNIQKLGFTKYYIGIRQYDTCANNNFTNVHVIGCGAVGNPGVDNISIVGPGNTITFTDCFSNNSADSGINCNTMVGLIGNAYGIRCYNCVLTNNLDDAFDPTHCLDCHLRGCDLRNCDTGAVEIDGSSSLYLDNCLVDTYSASITTSAPYYIQNTCGSGTFIKVNRHNRVDGRFITKISRIGIGDLGAICDHITGGQAADWAYGGSGISLLMIPNPNFTSALRTVDWEFLVPVTAATPFRVTFQCRETPGSNINLTVTIYDSHDDMTKLRDGDTVFTSTRWNLYTSYQVTPTMTGFCRVVLKAYSATAGSSVGIDAIRTI